MDAVQIIENVVSSPVHTKLATKQIPENFDIPAPSAPAKESIPAPLR
jgi:hypothetical protein